MLREERKLSLMKCSVKASKCRKRMEDHKKGTKNKDNKWKTVTPVVDTNPAASVIMAVI